MDNFNRIRTKLQEFIKKYYFNELIKGLLLFFSIGVLYFIFTLFVEHFLWLRPNLRTLLFWLFVFIEVALFAAYIVFPLTQILGLKNGISEVEASKIIGNHFPEIKDKLLNMLQLKESNQNSELIEASIEQKSKALQPIPFNVAVDLTKNKKYIKYALIPFVIWLLVFITGNSSIFSDSFSRVVHYNKVYLPPAPFSFAILNDSLSVVEGDSFTLQVEMIGNIIPENVKINFSNESYYLESVALGKFDYLFSRIQKPIKFYLEANGVASEIYQINCIPTPVINNLKMALQYPVYTGKKNEEVHNTGNTIVPQGTKITWQIETQKTGNVQFISENRTENFVQNTKDYFSYSKQLFNTISYKITTSNSQLNDYEALNFGVEVIPDEYPQIMVNSDIDSISRGSVQFFGQLSDDYGINKLQMVYYDKNNQNTLKSYLIPVDKAVITDFYYVFPEGISLDEGIDYELYFEVFDNDAVNGSKSSRSKTFSYYQKTEKEISEELLDEQKEMINDLDKLVEKSNNSNEMVEKFKNEIQKNADINWNDTKKLEELLKRQTQYQEMIQKQTNQLQNNLKEQSDQSQTKETKEELLKRIEETKKLAEQEKMMEELKELAKKLDKDDLAEKLKDMVKRNQRNEQSLERILELTKRFYVEQKANQLRENIENLAKKEDALSKDKEENSNISEKQKEINAAFENIKKESKELQKENQNLKRPMKLPDHKQEMESINNDLNKALQELIEQQSESAKESQKSAARKMKELSKSMEQSMAAMEGESIDENIEDLRKIVDNLIIFSFGQEDLMNRFSAADIRHPEYANNLKQQYILKEYFNYIDDSLYVLALRVVQMSTMIQKEVSEVHYNLDESLLNFTDDKADIGISNQQFVITSANNLANSLSNLLENLMNASPSFGKGKGKGNSPQFALPDIIKKQGELNEQIKDGIEMGEKEGKIPGENGEGMSEELYEIYKQQEQLKGMLKDILGDNPENPGGAGKAIKRMEDLEKALLEKGFTKEVAQKILQLNYELLKLQKAKLQQGEDDIRKSETPKVIFERRNIEAIELENPYFKTNEILNRQSLPLQTIYKKKVQEYFKKEQQ